MVEFAVAASLALLSHYFAVFLLLPMGVWLLWATIPRGFSHVLYALALPAIVGVALVPLISPRADTEPSGSENGLWRVAWKRFRSTT